jgi:predicted dehydrogenase
LLGEHYLAHDAYMSPPAPSLRFALFGTGFWARYQLAAWREVPGAECVALYNRTRHKAEALAREFGIAAVYDDPALLLERERLDFVDIVTDVTTHASLTHLAADRGIPVICQKPMATTFAEAEGMVAHCRAAGVPLFIHENFRWQTQLRELQALLAAGAIGEVFRGGIDFISGFPVFQNQPILAELEQFILTDLGSHLLDVARFFFGEAWSLSCRIGRVHANIRGEDHATVLLAMGPREIPVVVRMAYAENFVERECFPETLVFVEGSHGTLEMAPNFRLRLTTREGTLVRHVPPPFYPWADPRYGVVHSSIVPCHANLLSALRGEAPAETTGEDNLETIRLVFACYEAAARDAVVTFDRAPSP